MWSAELPEVIAALYVATGGIYFGRPDVDPWDKERDARLYNGPYAAVLHPPCERWGRYWSGGPSSSKRLAKGSDQGCFKAALASVRRWGGVLEHPEASAAWRHFELRRPKRGEGWVRADLQGGWTCCVEQGHYGHRARKATWLYAVDVELPELRWGSSAHPERTKLDVGFHSIEERRIFTSPPAQLSARDREKRHAWLAERAEESGKEWCCPERMNKSERAATPKRFAELLVSIAKTRDAYVERMIAARSMRRQVLPERWLRA